MDMSVHPQTRECTRMQPHVRACTHTNTHTHTRAHTCASTTSQLHTCTCTQELTLTLLACSAVPCMHVYVTSAVDARSHCIAWRCHALQAGRDIYDLGESLYAFLLRYGEEFDYETEAVSVASGGIVSKRVSRAFFLVRGVGVPGPGKLCRCLKNATRTDEHPPSTEQQCGVINSSQHALITGAGLHAQVSTCRSQHIRRL